MRRVWRWLMARCRAISSIEDWWLTEDIAHSSNSEPNPADAVGALDGRSEPFSPLNRRGHANIIFGRRFNSTKKYLRPGYAPASQTIAASMEAQRKAYAEALAEIE